MLKIDIFSLAEMQLRKEGKEPDFKTIVNYAKQIRLFIDRFGKLTDKILTGQITHQDKHNYKQKYNIIL